VSLDCLRVDPERFGDIAVGAAPGDEQRYLSLDVGELTVLDSAHSASSPPFVKVSTLSVLG
jgi:hypothetical protein